MADSPTRRKQATKVLPGPCHAEAEASRECMEQTGGVKSKCLDHFQAYKDCKTLLYEQKQQDRKDVFFGRK